MATDASSTPSVTLISELEAKVADQQLRMVWSHADHRHFHRDGFRSRHGGPLRQPVRMDSDRLWLSQDWRGRASDGSGTDISPPGSPGGGLGAVQPVDAFLDGIVWGTAGFWSRAKDSATTSLAIASLLGIVCVATFGLQVSRRRPRLTSCLSWSRWSLVCFSARMRSALLRCWVVLVSVSGSRHRDSLGGEVRGGVHAANSRHASVGGEAEALELASVNRPSKSRFLGTVSHELRTPIHGMLGIARLMHVDSPDPLVRKRMELIESTGTHLLGLVTDLIDVSRAGSEQMRIQRIAFNLSTEVQRVAEIYEVRAAEKGLAFASKATCAEDVGNWRSGSNATSAAQPSRQCD